MTLNRNQFAAPEPATCQYCNTQVKSKFALPIHHSEAHPDSPEAQETKRVIEQRNAEHAAHIASPGYQEALRRQQEEHERLQPMKHGPLYHGTRADLKPGDVIEPRSKSFAHATPHLHTAKVFGPKSSKGQGGRVYEVEPVDPDSAVVRQMKYTNNEVHYEVISEKGFRVKGPVL